MPSLVCFALTEEAADFRKFAAGRPDLAILVAGIGRVNATRSVLNYLAAHSPDLVFTCGFAGGLNPDLKLGDVVFEPGGSASAASGRPGELARTGWGEKLAAAGAKPGKFYCADHIATTAAEKKRLRHETGADAVEMESAAIQDVCRERRLPCLTVRVISDTADEDLPLDFNTLAKADWSLDPAKLAKAIARSPGKIGALLELRRKTRFAAKALAAVLARVISP